MRSLPDDTGNESQMPHEAEHRLRPNGKACSGCHDKLARPVSVDTVKRGIRTNRRLNKRPGNKKTAFLIAQKRRFFEGARGSRTLA